MSTRTCTLFPYPTLFRSPHPCRSQSGGGDRRMTNELSSPICYGPQADDAYMGYAPRDEILAALKELLEAERAIRGRFSLSRPDAGGQSRRSALVRDAPRTAQAPGRTAFA